MERDYQEFKLDNGLLVALERTPTKTIAGQLAVYRGTVDEREGEEGLAHFLEHVIVTSGAGEYTSRGIAEIRGALGHYNAQTHVDETLFGGGFVVDDLEKFLDIISSSIFHSSLDKEKIEQERQAILREISDRFGDRHYIDWKNHQKLVLGNHPLTLESLGTHDSVRRVTDFNLKNFLLEGYNVNNMELVLVGDLPLNVGALVNKYLGDKKPGQARGRYKFPLFDSLGKRVINHVAAPDLLLRDNPEQSNSFLKLDIFCPPRTHPDFLKLVTLSVVLGEGYESYLFNEIREREGLAYQIKSSYSGGHNKGNIGIDGRISARKTQEAIDIIFKCFNKLQTDLVDGEFLERAKRRIEYSFANDLESNEEKVGYIRGFLEHGMSVEKLLDATKKVTPQDVLETARRYLPKGQDDNYALLIRDPLRKE